MPKDNITVAFENLIGEINNNEVISNTSQNTTELDQLAIYVQTQVGMFLDDKHLSRSSGFNTVAIESLGDELSRLDGNNLVDLAVACNVLPNHLKTASAAIAQVLTKHARSNGNSSSAWTRQVGACENINNSTMASLTGMYSDSFVTDVTAEFDYSKEAFGIDMDRATTDLKLDLTIAIMKYHADLTAKMLPIRPTSEPIVRYTQDRAEVYDLNDAVAAPTQLVDLYKNPQIVDTNLKTIIPLLANSATLVVSDGVIVIGKEVNLFELALDPAKPGYTKYNRTDLVADGVLLQDVYVTITDGILTEQFLITIPASKARLTRVSDGMDVSERQINVEHTAFLTLGTLQSNGAASGILANAVDTQEGIDIKLLIGAKINLKTSVIWTSVNVSVALRHTTGIIANVSPAFTAEFGLITAPVINGITIDAKYNEENMRKGNIAVRTARQPFSYEIHPGRNYMVDSSIQQADSANVQGAILTRVIRIGQGRRTLATVIDGLNTAAAAILAFANGSSDDNPARRYIAGSKIKPYVYTGTMDLTTLTAIKDADRSGDIKAHAITYLNAVIAKIETNSFFNQQLTPGAKSHYRVVTSNEIADNVLAQSHIHDHLNNTDKSVPGIYLRIVLPCGAILDIITSTDVLVSTRLIMYAILPDAPESDCNFAVNWDAGSMVGHYSITDASAANNRMFANTREIAIIQNPVGAIIDIAGMINATFL